MRWEAPAAPITHPQLQRQLELPLLLLHPKRIPLLRLLQPGSGKVSHRRATPCLPHSAPRRLSIPPGTGPEKHRPRPPAPLVPESSGARRTEGGGPEASRRLERSSNTLAASTRRGARVLSPSASRSTARLVVVASRHPLTHPVRKRLPGTSRRPRWGFQRSWVLSPGLRLRGSPPSPPSLPPLPPRANTSRVRLCTPHGRNRRRRK